MAAVGIVGLAIASASSLRTVLLSFRQRYEHFSDNEKEFDDVVDDLARITENLREIEQRMNSIPREDNGGHVDRHLKTVNKRLLASRETVNKLGKGPWQVHSGPSRAHMTGMCSQITGANRIHDKLNKVSANFRQVDGLLDTVATLLGISELSRTQGSAEGVDRHLCISSVPILSHQEVLSFDGKDENGNPTPEAQLKMHVLHKQSKKVVAAAGDASGRHRAKVPSAQGMAGVGKTVALKGLGWDKDIQKAFDEIHYITLGHDATADIVVSELARIVEISGGERQSSAVRRCKDVNSAVLHTSKWFSGRKCLFLVDDVWKTGENNYGYLPTLRQLLASSEKSRMAISTRDRNIASESGQTVEFGPRGNATSRKMFLGYFGTDTPETLLLRGSGAESLDKIIDLCGGIPLALSIAGRGARGLKDEGRNAVRALEEYAKRLDGRRSNLLEKMLPEYGRDDESLTLRAAIETSLDFLGSRDELAGTSCDMGIGEMYRALGVLKAQAWAPVSTLSRLWKIGQEDAERIMGQLRILSLAEVEDSMYKVVRLSEECREGRLKLHDLQLEYCRQHCKDISRWHCRLLDGYLEASVGETRTQESVHENVLQHEADDAIFDVEPRPWWSESVAEDNYVHENVAWHLVQSGNRDELRGLLVDARWIMLRLKIGGIFALESDFAELAPMEGIGAIFAEGSAAKSTDSEFRPILNALRCSWQYVVENGRELAVQLGGRLFGVQESSAAARKLVKSAIRNSEKPFAEARYGFLPDARSEQVNEVHLGELCESFSYSNCGKYIAASAGKDVVIVEVGTLTEKLRFSGHTDRASGVCFLPQSSKIVSGSWDNTVRVWDLNKPDNNVLTLEGHTASVNSVCASADGSRVASGSNDGTVRLWRLQDEENAGAGKGKRSKWMSWFGCRGDGTNGTKDVDSEAYGCKVLQGHTRMVMCVCFSPDGALLASASFDRTVRLWNGQTGKHTGVTIDVHEGLVCCVTFSPDGEHVAAGSSDGAIRLWRADSGAPAGIVIRGHSGWVRSVTFSADGGRIVSTSSDKTVRLWSARTGAAIGSALKGHTDGVTGAVLCPNGARVAPVSFDGTLRIWEPERAGGVSASYDEGLESVRCAAFGAHGTRIAVGCFDGAICLWDAQSGRTVGGRLRGHAQSVECIVFSPDGALLASGSDDGTVRLWDARTGAAVGSALEGHNSWVHKVLFSADGSILMSYSSQNKCRCLWDMPSGARLWMSHRSGEDATNALSDAEAKAIIKAIKRLRRLDAPNETPVVYCDKDGSVYMKRNEGDVRLASLPPVAGCVSGISSMHLEDRGEFAAVLRDGRPICLTLHL